MAIDVSMIPQNRIENLLTKINEIENNISNIGTDTSNNIVHKNGNEIINGIKTYTSNIQIQSSGDGSLQIQDTALAKGTTPSENNLAGFIGVYDSTGITNADRMGGLNLSYKTSGHISSSVVSYQPVLNSDKAAEIGIEISETAAHGFIAVNSDLTNESLNKSTNSTTDVIIPCMGWVNNPAASTNVVHKTGDETISGSKTFTSVGHWNVSGNAIQVNNSNMDTTVVSASNTYGGIQFGDKNGVRIGKIETCSNTAGNYTMSINAHRNVNGTAKYSSVTCYVDTNGIDKCSFPKCTSKATTTSSAGSDKVAVIVTNYKSGTSWYRIWSDGWIEQGGMMPTTTNSVTINFNKAFTTTDICILTTECQIGSTDTDGVDFTTLIKTVSTSNFSASTVTKRTNYWYACGY